MRRAMLMLGVLAVFTGLAYAAPVPKSIKAKPVVRKTIEPLAGEKLYSVEWDDVPLKKVAEELENLSGLLFLSKDVPKVNVTMKAEKVCLPELFALVNDELVPKGYALGRKSQSFGVLKTEAPLDRIWCPTITPEELARRGPEEPVQLVLPAFDQDGVDRRLKYAEAITHKWFEVKSFGSEKVLVVGRAADVQQLRDKFAPEVEERTEAERAERQRFREWLRRGG